jgi:hypothetical protein
MFALHERLFGKRRFAATAATRAINCSVINERYAGK